MEAALVRPAAPRASGGKREQTKVQNRQIILEAARQRLRRDGLWRGHGARHHPRHAARVGHVL